MMEKLFHIRNEMHVCGVDAYIQPVHDEYMSEYPPAYNRRVEWFCGFSGSAGALAVTADNAALFVDGRYTLQAAQQLDALQYEIHNSADKNLQVWLAEILPANARVGYDPRLYTQAMLARMEAVFANKHIVLVAVPNLVDMIWKDRPQAPASLVFVHEEKYSGKAISEKYVVVNDVLKKAGADAIILSAPESVNWLLNIRGRDVENTPLVLAVAVVNISGVVQLYVDPARCSAEVRLHLGDSVEIHSPELLQADLHACVGKRILYDPQELPVWFINTLRMAGAILVEGSDPCILSKALKNAVELEGMRRAHIRDGAAVAKLLCWLDAQTQVTELVVVNTLLSFRKQNDLFVEPSFDTIAGSGEHGAIVHYRATEASNRQLQKGDLFLLDSGGQYFDGTTDITRTVAFGVPSAEHKDRFTRVLKGHIALAMARFPAGTSGSQLDALARQFLWAVGLDYDHGTGHGVGCFLGVHEGPQRISKRAGDVALVAGMVLSNEPGYYKAGDYGIRIENLLAVVDMTEGAESRKFLGFETLTCAPIDTRLVDVSLLSAEEKQWLNNYHAWVLSELSPQLSIQENAWLVARCAAI